MRIKTAMTKVISADGQSPGDREQIGTTIQKNKLTHEQKGVGKRRTLPRKSSRVRTSDKLQKNGWEKHQINSNYVESDGSQRSSTIDVVPLSTRIANSDIKRSRPLTLIGITCAETMDLIFPNWYNFAFIGKGNDAAYRPYNLNMPSSLLKRPAAHYELDSPITEHGKLCAALTARGILLAGYRPSAIFTSPELRCIETAQSIRRVFHIDDCELCVEPSLAEYGTFRDCAQDYWLSSTRLKEKGIKINSSYVPLLTVEQLNRNESPREFMNRMQQFYQYIIMNFAEECVIVVSNISGIFVLIDGVATKSFHLQEQYERIGFCALYAIAVNTKGKVSNIKNPIRPLTRTLYDAELKQKIENSKQNED